MTWSDRELADGLEGLLDPDVAEALEAEVACDSELAARQAALRAILAPPVTLPPLTVPAGLEETTAQRLRELPSDAALAEALEGLGQEELLARAPSRARALRRTLAEAQAGGEEVLPELAPPPGFLGSVLAHLEAEGLLPPAEAAPRADEDLAALLEGVLAPGEAASLERDLGRDPRLRQRLDALRAVLADEAELAPLPLPASLADAVSERLLDEGLVREDLEEGASLPVRPPHDLLARTLGRLESASLVEPAPAPAEVSLPAPAPLTPTSPPDLDSRPAGLLLTFPRVLLAAAALLLVGAGLGVVAAPAEDATAALELAQGEADSARQELSEVSGRLGAAREALRLAEEAARAERADRAREAQDLATAQGEVLQARRELALLRDRLSQGEGGQAELRAALERAKGELAAGKALLARREGALEELRETLAGARSSLAGAQEALRQRERLLGESRAARQEAETQRALAQAELEKLAGRSPAGMRVANATQIERWDAETQSWSPIGPETTLGPGALVRGLSAESTLQVSGLLPYQLRSGVYVIRDDQRLVPLPANLHREVRRSPEPAPDDVLAWIELLQSPSALERSRASQALRSQFHALGGEGQPPTTAAAWTRWWSQARRLARR